MAVLSAEISAIDAALEALWQQVEALRLRKAQLLAAVITTSAASQAAAISIPDAVQEQVLLTMSTGDVVALGTTCHSWYRAERQPNVWSALFQRDLCHRHAALLRLLARQQVSVLSWRSLYADAAAAAAVAATVNLTVSVGMGAEVAVGPDHPAGTIGVGWEADEAVLLTTDTASGIELVEAGTGTAGLNSFSTTSTAAGVDTADTASGAFAVELLTVSTASGVETADVATSMMQAGIAHAGLDSFSTISTAAGVDTADTASGAFAVDLLTISTASGIETADVATSMMQAGIAHAGLNSFSTTSTAAGVDTADTASGAFAVELLTVSTASGVETADVATSMMQAGIGHADASTWTQPGATPLMASQAVGSDRADVSTCMAPGGLERSCRHIATGPGPFVDSASGPDVPGKFVM